MFKKVDILFFVEHKDRELEITKEICKEIKISNQNISIKVASLIFHTFFCIIFYTPKVVITPSPAFGWGSVSRIFNFIYGDKIKFINLNYEQYVGEWESKLKLNWHKVSKKKQFHFCWHEDFKNKIISMGVTPENVRTTDRPHDWLVMNKYKNTDKLMLKKTISEECKISNKKKWIFIAMTDGIAFLNRNKINQVVGRGVPEDKFLKNISIIKEQITELFKWIKKYQSDNENAIFILRPHPSVGKEDYLNFIQKRNIEIPNNFHIEKRFNASDWIYVADFYVTNYSTLSLDAKTFKKNASYIDPISCPSPYKYWWLDSINRARDFIEFNSQINIGLYQSNTKSDEEYSINNSIKQSSKFIVEILSSSSISRDESNILIFFRVIGALSLFFKRIFGSLLRYILVRGYIPKTKKHIESLSYDFFKIKNY